MIEYLRGVLLEKSDGHLVVDVNGVGYGLSVPETTARAAGDPGSEISLWVRTYVREDALRLFGFATRHEREVFDVFLSLSGIGPGTGLSILSTLSVAEIVQATMAGDASRFKGVKGVGPKTAEKLILELKGKVKRLAVGLTPEERQDAAASPEPVLATEAANDAVAALEALEVRPQQARRAVALALEALGSQATASELVREGLKYRR
jgi:Holliday junction DNA helicase RuvA